jgi:hypothetical protein
VTITSTAIPRTIVKLGLRGIRLPLSIAELVGERAGLDVAGSPPVAFYNEVEGQAKQVIGRLLQDEQLSSEGRRQASASQHRIEGQVFSKRAEEVREGADARLQETMAQAEESRDEIEARAEERKAEIQRQEEEAKAEARQRAQKRQQAVRQAAKSREKAVEAKERKAELARLKAEAEALEKANEAVQAEKVVTAIDEHLEARQESRRNGTP